MAAWIFQGNPIRFDVDEFVQAANPITWTVNQRFRNTLKPGDRVYLWRSDGKVRGSGGVIGLGQVVSEPVWSEGEEPRWIAYVEVQELRLSEPAGMLLRTDLERHPTLSMLTILKIRTGSNFRLTADQDDDLFDLWMMSSH